MKSLFIIVAPFILALVAYSVISSEKVSVEFSRYSGDRDVMFELYMDMYYNGAIVIYGTGNKKFVDDYKAFAEKIRQRYKSVKIKIKADTSATEQEINNNSLFLIGTKKSNKIINKLNGKLPVVLKNNELLFDKSVYNNPADLVTFIIPNPANKNKLLYVHTGVDDRFVSQFIKFDFIGDLLITRGHQTLVMSAFSYDDKNNWMIDIARTRNFNVNTKTVLKTKFYNYILKTDDLNRIDIKQIDRQNENNLKLFSKFFEGEIKLPKLNFNIYGNFEDKGLITLNTTLSHLDESENSVHVVINDWISGNDFSKNALFYLRENFGKAKNEFLERAFSNYFSDNWRGKGYKYWAARLAQSGNVPPLATLFDKSKSVYESDFVIDPLAGAFVDFIIKKIGKEKFVAKYPKWNPQKNELNKLESSWKSYLNKLIDDYKNQIKTDRENFKVSIPKFMKGFNFAHEGYEIHNGYLSRTAYQSLKKLVGLNINSIAINPFTSMRDEKQIEPLAFWRSPHTENDQSMIYLAHVAKELNLTLLMKPHIYLHRSWPGGIEMSSKKEWKKFIDGYYRWIRHYAIISEMYNIPILCVGNELVNATLENEDEWIKIFDKIRKIYSGKLVYGANWGKEFENLTFWKHLDYIGVSNYYPISKKDNPTDEDLITGANEVLDKIERIAKKYNKPVIFTEAGFRSSGAPWQSSFESEKNRSDTSFANQVRTYNALLQAAYERDWLAGIFWWKWPSYLQFGGDPHRDLYTPNGKPAEETVKKWYSKNWR